jgi:hypothetical protein
MLQQLELKEQLEWLKDGTFGSNFGQGSENPLPKINDDAKVTISLGEAIKGAWKGLTSPTG